MEVKIFEKPKRFRTRNGCEVIVFCRGKGSMGEKYFGIINNGTEFMDSSWLVCGKYNAFVLEESCLDLVEEL